MGSSLVPLKSALLMTRRKKGSWNIGGIKVQRGYHQQIDTRAPKSNRKGGEWDWDLGRGFVRVSTSQSSSLFA